MSRMKKEWCRYGGVEIGVFRFRIAVEIGVSGYRMTKEFDWEREEGRNVMWKR